MQKLRVLSLFVLLVIAFPAYAQYDVISSQEERLRLRTLRIRDRVQRNSRVPVQFGIGQERKVKLNASERSVQQRRLNYTQLRRQVNRPSRRLRNRETGLSGYGNRIMNANTYRDLERQALKRCKGYRNRFKREQCNARVTGRSR